MISLPYTKGEQKNPAVDTGLIQNLTDSKRYGWDREYLDVIYKEVGGMPDYHGLKQISRELFMLLKKNYAHLPKQMGQDFALPLISRIGWTAGISERGSSVSLILNLRKKKMQAGGIFKAWLFWLWNISLSIIRRIVFPSMRLRTVFI